MAQLSGILGFKTVGGPAEERVLHYLAGSNKVRFKRPVVPGDQLRMECHLISAKHGIWKYDCKAMVGDEIVCVAEVMTAEREV